MNREAVERWVAELESTDAPQVYGTLRRETLPGRKGYCALGIGVLVAARELTSAEECFDEDLNQTWSQQVADYYGWRSPTGREPLIKVQTGDMLSVSRANDVIKLSFWEIAQAIRATYLKDEE